MYLLRSLALVWGCILTVSGKQRSEVVHGISFAPPVCTTLADRFLMEQTTAHLAPRRPVDRQQHRHNHVGGRCGDAQRTPLAADDAHQRIHLAGLAPFPLPRPGRGLTPGPPPAENPFPFRGSS